MNNRMKKNCLPNIWNLPWISLSTSPFCAGCVFVWHVLHPGHCPSFMNTAVSRTPVPSHQVTRHRERWKYYGSYSFLTSRRGTVNKWKFWHGFASRWLLNNIPFMLPRHLLEVKYIMIFFANRWIRSFIQIPKKCQSLKYPLVLIDFYKNQCVHLAKIT